MHRFVLGFLFVVQAAATSATLPAAAWAGQADKQTTEIRLGYNPVWTTPFLLIGKERGTIDSPKAQIRWLTFQTPNQVMEAMAAGELDAGILTPANHLVGLDKGLAITAIAIESGWSEPTSTYMVRVDSGINSVKDLRGKTIGVNNYGGVFDLYLRHMLEQNGMDPKKDVKVVEVPIPTIYPALSTKQIDAGSVPALFVPVAEARFKGQFKKLFDFKDVPDVRDRPQINQLILSVGADYLRTHRDTLKAHLENYVENIRWSFANKAEATALWAKASKVEVVKTLPDPFGPNTQGKMDEGAMELDAALLKKYGYTKKTDFGSKKVLDHSLIDEVLARK